jgi:AHBA synthesis associated protein
VTAAVLFDLDGTLVDSEPVTRAAFCGAYREVMSAGRAPVERYLEHLGRPFPDIMRELGLPLELWEPFRRRSTQLAGRVRVAPGVPAMLAALAARGVPLAIVTGKDAERAEHVLRRCGLRDRFASVVTPDRVARGKPHPDSIEVALADLGADPRGSVVVGDAAADIEAAHAAGVRAVAAAWLPTPAVARAAAIADRVVRRPMEVVALVGERVPVA